ncbi:MAG: hypothetical protein JKY03_09680 [Aureispira sp.]|nr:hypothetical protein [Aureispira sp.]
MTRQIAEIVTYKNENYIFSGYTNKISSEFGIEPAARLTACYRGFKRTFNVKEDHLYLQKLGINDTNLNIADFENYKPVLINGVSPEFNHEKEHSGLLFHMNYTNVNQPIDYTGSILIGRNEVNRGFHYHFDTHAVWKYGEVFLLKFNKGALEKADDLSSKMEEIRLEFKKAKSDESKLEDIQNQIKLVFDSKMGSDIY